jgi:putative component of membrane protein insertase Oxa1/YidC/SpoIIIJ protein YidD
MLSSSAIAVIGFYQRHVSPWKGYCCAHRMRTGRASCSGFAKRAIGRAGLRRGLCLLGRRFAACSASARALATAVSASAEETKEPGEQEKPRKSGSDDGPDLAYCVPIECCVYACLMP